MRKIKFRVWDKEEKEFDFPSEFRVQKGQIGWTEDHYLDIDSYSEYDRFVLQQFTGLTDKNGVEIYEGDIIEIDGEDRKNEITFDKGSFCFDEEDGFESTSLFDYNDMISVIGNVMQNTELIQ